MKRSKKSPVVKINTGINTNFKMRVQKYLVEKLPQIIWNNANQW